MIFMKACVICFDFKKENLKKQPWRYIFEICKDLDKQGIEVTLITNIEESIEGFNIKYVKQLRSIFGESKELLNVLKEENPDVIISLIGVIDLARKTKLNKLNKPIIGILTSPIYSLKEIVRIGISEFLRHFNHIIIHLIGALTPTFLIKKYANYFDCIVVLSRSNKKRLKKIGVNTKILVLPAGIDKFYLEPPNKQQVDMLRKKLNPENLPVIMYYTSPLTLRGTDILIKAFAKVRKLRPYKLIILSRPEYETKKEEKLLIKIAEKEGVVDSINIISKYLNPKEIREHLAVAQIICLPFKIIISDNPISILEAMALGKPVISTNVGCIPELLDNRGLIIQPNNVTELENAIMMLLNNKEMMENLGKKSKEYMQTYPCWDDIRKRFVEVIQEMVKEWRPN